MNGGQVAMIVLYAVSLVLNIETHGKPREPNNAWYALVGLVLQVAILWWGGFWS